MKATLASGILSNTQTDLFHRVSRNSQRHSAASRKAHDANRLHAVTGELRGQIDQIKASRKEAAQQQRELQAKLNHANGKESKKGRNVLLQAHTSGAYSSSSGRVKSAPPIKKHTESRLITDISCHSSCCMTDTANLGPSQASHPPPHSAAASVISAESVNKGIEDIFPSSALQNTQTLHDFNTDEQLNGPFTAMLNSDFIPSYDGDLSLTGFDFSDFNFDFDGFDLANCDGHAGNLFPSTATGNPAPAFPVPLQDHFNDVDTIFNTTSPVSYSFGLPLLPAPPMSPASSTTDWPSSPTPLTSTDGPPAPLRPPSPIIPKKRQRDEVDVRDILPEGRKRVKIPSTRARQIEKA